MASRANQVTLEKKLDKWKRILKLSDWRISIKYATRGEIPESAIAIMHNCSPPEKIAFILIDKQYYTYEGYKTVWNLDTLIIHELIHVVIYRHVEILPAKLKKLKLLKHFEEYMCDFFAKTIYDITKRK